MASVYVARQPLVPQPELGLWTRTSVQIGYSLDSAWKQLSSFRPTFCLERWNQGSIALKRQLGASSRMSSNFTWKADPDYGGAAAFKLQKEVPLRRARSHFGALAATRPSCGHNSCICPDVSDLSSQQSQSGTSSQECVPLDNPSPRIWSRLHYFLLLCRDAFSVTSVRAQQYFAPYKKICLQHAATVLLAVALLAAGVWSTWRPNTFISPRRRMRSTEVMSFQIADVSGTKPLSATLGTTCSKQSDFGYADATELADKQPSDRSWIRFLPLFAGPGAKNQKTASRGPPFEAWTGTLQFARQRHRAGREASSFHRQNESELNGINPGTSSSQTLRVRCCISRNPLRGRRRRRLMLLEPEAVLRQRAGSVLMVSSLARVEDQQPSSSGVPAGQPVEFQKAGAWAPESLVVRTAMGTIEEEMELDAWLEGIKSEALQQGISPQTVEVALTDVRPLPKVVEKERSQPEVLLSAKEYIGRMVTEYSIRKGVAAYESSRAVLEEVEAEYGVPASVLVALWGVESSYGRNAGGFDVVQALLTLAHNNTEPRRRTFFRRELLEALRIMEAGQGPSGGGRLRGSWAGAMGQSQFLPSSYRAYAVDHDGDGRADIWTSPGDIFASMANYLVKNGWQRGQPSGQKVRLQKGIDRSLLGLKVKKPVQEWRTRYHVTAEGGEPQLASDAPASLVVLDGPAGEAYLACENFRALLRYNPSSSYALSIAHLASEIRVRVSQSEASQTRL